MDLEDGTGLRETDMLNEPQPDIRELLDLARMVENFYAAVADSHMADQSGAGRLLAA